MATVKEQVGEVLLGAVEEPQYQLSHMTRSAFMKFAKKDEQTGEHYLDEESFIDAVTPESEDYVCLQILTHFLSVLVR
jgi:solute carrier family 25 aspartate/glutamate transporter 12/13